MYFTNAGIVTTIERSTMVETRCGSRVKERVLREAARARSRIAKEHFETARRAASAAKAGALQAEDAVKKAEKRKRERKFIGKEKKRKMDAWDVARGVDLDDVIEKARKMAAAAKAIAEIKRAEASEARKHARDAAKEVRACALAFNKRLIAKYNCSTQPSQ